MQYNLMESAKRLVLRYNQGQFSFSRFDRLADDEQLLGLADYINSLQEDEAEEVVTVQVLQLVPPVGSP